MYQTQEPKKQVLVLAIFLSMTKAKKEAMLVVFATPAFISLQYTFYIQ